MLLSVGEETEARATHEKQSELRAGISAGFLLETFAPVVLVEPLVPEMLPGGR